MNDENEDMTANESAAVKAESASNGISEECQSPEIKELEEELASTKKKRGPAAIKAEDDEEDDEPVRKRSRKAKPENISQPMSTTNPRSPSREKSSPNKSASTRSSPAEISAATKPLKAKVQPSEEDVDEESAETEPDLSDDNEPEKPSTSKTTREKIQATLKANNTDLYPDWNPGEPVPYAALCATFLPVELTTKRLAIMAHCALFLRQVLRLTPEDLLPAIQLMINKLAADYAGIELGIGESLIMKAIGEATGRSLAVIKSDHNEIGDLGLVAAKSRSNQPTMFKPKPLTVRGVLDSLMHIAVISGNGAQQRKVDGIKKLLAAADIQHAGKGSKGIDITKDKGGPSEAKYIVRFLEGKLRLGLAERTVLVSLAHAVITHEVETKTGKMPSQEKLAEAEAILKTVYR